MCIRDRSTEFDDLFLSRRISQAARDVCQGEILQTQKRFDLSMTQEDYFRVIEMKTGALFGAATGLSAYISGASESEVQDLTQFGLDLGTAYQIYDDCLDIVGSEQQFGKTLGTDLEKGKLTLPLLYLLQNATDEKQQRIKETVMNEQPLDLPRLVGQEDYETAVAYALNYSLQLIQQCIDTANALPNAKYRTALCSVCEYMRSLFQDLQRDL